MEDRMISQLAGRKVLVSGDFMLDEYIMGNVRRISPEAPVPVLEVEKRETGLGGAGNVIQNLVSLGAFVRAVTCLGMDAAGEEVIRRLNERKVDTRFIQRLPQEKTSLKTRIVSRGQQFLRYDEESIRDVAEVYCDFVEASLEEIFDGIEIMIISDYGKGNASERMCRLLICEAGRRGLAVIVDPKGKEYDKYRGATVCTPNMQEFILACGVADHPGEEEIGRLGCKLCRDKGFQHLLITRSEDGMTLIEGSSGAKKDFPAIKKEVIDVTGAGDTVISVFSLGLAAGQPLKECCILANKAASLVVSRFGAVAVTLEELKGEETSIQKKILNQEEAVSLAGWLRREGKKIVFTNGCFDLIHAGHVASFEKGRALGDCLIVGLNSDASVRHIKGSKRPVIGEQNRARLLSSLSMVDYVVIFDEDTPERLISRLLPDVLVKGRDWEQKKVIGEDVVRGHGGKVELVDLEEGLSTTKIIEKIRKEEIL